jgi:membrane-associated protease RseP (regulator of RpoE activity)
LFVVTFVTVWIGGAFLADAEPFVVRGPGIRGLWVAVGSWLMALRPGLEFAMGLMAILLAHETGHYLTAKRYGLNVSPPYFLPAPPVSSFFFVGTFGAFIRLRSPVVDRRQLFDVGAAGPWAGFVVAGIVLVAGLLLSQPVDTGRADAAQIIMFGSRPLYLGDSLIMAGARHLLAGEGTILLHPLAFAGWLGLFVTMLNLLPLGQLDGGHVLYGLIGDRQKQVAYLMWLALVVMGTPGIGFWGWWVWAAFTMLLGRGRLGHPSVLDRFRPVPRNRRPLGWATVALFVGTFTPIPFYI